MDTSSVAQGAHLPNTEDDEPVTRQVFPTPRDVREAIKVPVNIAESKPPRTLSPSAAALFKDCPRQYYYGRVLRISTPAIFPQIVGTLIHGVCERVLDLAPEERTTEAAKTLIPGVWAEILNPALDEKSGEVPFLLAERAKQYALFLVKNPDSEQQIFSRTEKLVDSWFAMEKIDKISATATTPQGEVIDSREVKVFTPVGGTPLFGFIDRLDHWVDENGISHYAVTDYKSGRVPDEKVGASQEEIDALNAKAFEQLWVYALMCKEIYDIDVEYLRLVYVKTGSRENGIKTIRVSQDGLDVMRKQMFDIWKEINKAVITRNFEAKPASPSSCNNCYFKAVCPAQGAAIAATSTRDETIAFLDSPNV